MSAATVAALPKLLEVQAVMNRYGLRDRRAAAVLRWLRSSGRETVSVREVHRALGSAGKFPDEQTVRAALGVLDEHVYVRALPQPSSGPQGGRQSSPRYAIHPGIGGDSRPPS